GTPFQDSLSSFYNTLTINTYTLSYTTLFRSMDLSPRGLAGEPTVAEALASGVDAVVFSGDKLLGGPQAGILLGARAAIDACRKRSEEHTSELQSRGHLVCRLLLEKKNSPPTT